MQELTPEGRQIVENLARNYSVSPEAVQVLLQAIAAGYGTQAQFNHPDLGGMGQWSQGGMIMIGDMFNQGLKNKVNSLCEEIAGILRNQMVFAPPPAQTQSQVQSGGGGTSFFVPAPNSNMWWPADLGAPSATGAQNDMRYACFPAAHRLAIQQGGETRVYDTGEHNIGGFSQQQGGDQSLTFTSQFGLVRVADLPLVMPSNKSNSTPPRHSEEPTPSAPGMPPAQATAPASKDDIFTHIERLAELRDKKILSDDEFAAKKAELLGRL